MNKDTFFRMSFILQDNSATTTRTYLAKIIESLLFDSPKELSIDELREGLDREYLLEFSNEEIRSALQYQITKTSHIIEHFNKYSLTPEYFNKLSTIDSVDIMLRKYIKLAINDNNWDVDEDYLFSLITRHLYNCFNTNKSVLLSLIDGTPLTNTETISFSNNDISLINSFLRWNNAEKNKLIYQIVSYCYVYCTLNTKKDILLSKSIFKNKHFFLDANIIFRLAGINNDDRQNTISTFVNKCNEVGIKLSFTSATFDEVYRVISSKVSWIKGITHSKEPINIDLEAYGNDFYNLYVDWCKKPGNNYEDFVAFQSYLNNLVNEVLQNLDYVQMKEIELSSVSDFSKFVEDLKKYKNNNTYKPQSTGSVETDISNLIYLLNKRKNSTKGNLFSTNLFFISADQNLINWSQQITSGVPLIVLPSIWLTILLRFTGRSNDDYKSFVSFMNLRTHTSENDIDIFALIRELGFHTDDKLLKEKIVSEVILHKDDYLSLETDTENILYKAFDTIRFQENQLKEIEFEKQISSREEELIKEKEDALQLSQNQERDKNILLLVANKITNKQRIPNAINKAKYPIALIIGFFLITVTIMWLYRLEPIYSIYESIFPSTLTAMSDKFVFIGAIWTILGVIYGILSKVTQFFTSEAHIKKLREKYTRHFTKLLSNPDIK